MKKADSALLYIGLCTVFTSFGQLFIKLGVDKLELTPIGVLTDVTLMIGLFLYAVGAIVFIYALKFADLSVVYPLISMSFIWVSILSTAFLGEVITWTQWLGILVIIAGVSLVVSTHG